MVPVIIHHIAVSLLFTLPFPPLAPVMVLVTAAFPGKVTRLVPFPLSQ